MERALKLKDTQLKRILLEIPTPPPAMLDPDAWQNIFTPAPEFGDFLKSSLLNEQNFLFNPEHLHLFDASIGFLWTNTPNVRRMKIVGGECERPNFKGGAFQRGRQEYQMQTWFGGIPDFTITFHAGIWDRLSQIERLALFEHEIYHCGQALDEFGMPKFGRRSGLPIFALRGHDVEEFIGIVRRYGAHVAGADRVGFIEAGLSEPLIAPADVVKYCGSC